MAMDNDPIVAQAEQAAMASQYVARANPETPEQVRQRVIAQQQLKPDTFVPGLDEIQPQAVTEAEQRTYQLRSPTWLALNSSLDTAPLVNADPRRMNAYAQAIDAMAPAPTLDPETNFEKAKNSLGRGMWSFYKATDPSSHLMQMDLRNAMAQDPYWAWLNTDEAKDALSEDERQRLLAEREAKAGLVRVHNPETEEDMALDPKRMSEVFSSEGFQQDLANMANADSFMQIYPASEKMQELTGKEGLELFNYVLQNPGTFLVEGMPELTVGSLAPLALAYGAMATIPGSAGLTTAALASGLGAQQMDYTQQLFERLQDKVDIHDTEALRSFFLTPDGYKQFEEADREARAHAMAAGVSTGLSFRALGVNVGNVAANIERSARTIRKLSVTNPGAYTQDAVDFARKVEVNASIVRRLAATGKLAGQRPIDIIGQFGIQGFLGGGGEAIGQLAADNEITDQYSILANFLGEGLTAPADIFVAHIDANRANRMRMQKTMENTMAVMQAQENLNATAAGQDPVLRREIGKLDRHTYTVPNPVLRQLAETDASQLEGVDAELLQRIRKAAQEGNDLTLNGEEYTGQVSRFLAQEAAMNVGVDGAASLQDMKLAFKDTEDFAQITEKRLAEGRDPYKDEEYLGGTVEETPTGDVVFKDAAGDTMEAKAKGPAPTIKNEKDFTAYTEKALRRQNRASRKESRANLRRTLGDDLTARTKSGMTTQEKTNFSAFALNLLDTLHRWTGLPHEVLWRRYGNSFHFLGMGNVKFVKRADGKYDAEIRMPGTAADAKPSIVHDVDPKNTKGLYANLPYGAAIARLAQGDKSTFFHEFAHAYFDMMVSLATDLRGGTFTPFGAEFFKGDVAAARKWLESQSDLPSFVDEEGHLMNAEKRDAMMDAMAKRLVNANIKAKDALLPFPYSDFLQTFDGLLQWLVDDVGIKLSKDSQADYAKAQEAFARSFEQELANGFMPNSYALARIFDNIRNGMLVTYKTLDGQVPGAFGGLRPTMERILYGKNRVNQLAAAMPVLDVELLRTSSNGVQAWDGLSREQKAEIFNLQNSVYAQARALIDAHTRAGTAILASIDRRIVKDVKEGKADYVIKARANLARDMETRNYTSYNSPIKDLSSADYRVLNALTESGKGRIYFAKDSLEGLGLTDKDLQTLNKAGVIYRGQKDVPTECVVSPILLMQGMKVKNSKAVIKRLLPFLELRGKGADKHFALEERIRDAVAERIRRSDSEYVQLKRDAEGMTQVDEGVAASSLYNQGRTALLEKSFDLLGKMQKLATDGVKEIMRIRARAYVNGLTFDQLGKALRKWPHDAQHYGSRARQAMAIGDANTAVTYLRWQLQLSMFIEEARKAQTLARRDLRSFNRFKRKEVKGVSGGTLVMIRQALQALGVASRERLHLNPTKKEIEDMNRAWRDAQVPASVKEGALTQMEEGYITEAQAYKMVGADMPVSMGEVSLVEKLRKLEDPENEDRPSGASPSFPEPLLRAIEKGDTTYIQTPHGLAQLVDLVGTLKTLDDNSRVIELVGGKKISFEDAINKGTAQVNATADAHGKPKEIGVKQNTTWQRMVKGMKSFVASLDRPIAILTQMDGKRGGVLYKIFVEPLMKMANKDEALQEQFARKVRSILESVKTTINDKKIFTSSVLGDRFSRSQAFWAACYMGNEGNKQRLLASVSSATRTVTEADMYRFFGETLTAKDWLAVQKIWDLFGELQPEMDAMARRLTGQPPVWVQPTVVRTGQFVDGKELVLRGGYFPIRYDPAHSSLGARIEKIESAKDMVPAFGGSMLPSVMKERAGDIAPGNALLLTEYTMFRGLNDSIHFACYAKWVNDASRLLANNNELAKAIRNRYGEEALDVLHDWVNAVKTGGRTPKTPGQEAIDFLARNVSVSAMGLRVSTALMQITGAVQSAVALGTGNYLHGITTLLGGEGLAANIRRINEISPMMRNRLQTQFRDINTAALRATNTIKDLQQKMMQVSFRPLQLVQATVDYTTWMGAFEKSRAEHPKATLEEHVLAADRMVMDAQGSGRLTELSGIERNRGAWRLLLAFYSFFNASWNLMKTQAAINPGMKGKMDVFNIVMTQSILAAMVKAAFDGEQPNEDDTWVDKAERYALEEPAAFFTGLFPIVREFSGTFSGYDYSGPGGLRPIYTANSLLLRGLQAMGDEDKKFLTMATAKDTADMAGYLFGVPGGAIKGLLTGTQALVEDKTNNPFVLFTGYKEPRR